MTKLIDEFFFLRRSERRALVIMILFLVCLLSFRVWIAVKPAPGQKMDEEILAEMLKMKHALKEEQEGSSELSSSNSRIKSAKQSITPFTFDPNRIPADSLAMLNLPPFLRQNILKYREAGGYFKSREDLKKIYGMDSTIFHQLEKYIRLKPSVKKTDAEGKVKWDSTFFRKEAPEQGMDPLELNTADSIELRTIPGIGLSYSRRIIKYRDLLGGYYSKEQLMEIYGMDSARFVSLCQYTLLDSLNIKKINLNQASYKELISHPYITKSASYAILQYREFSDSIEHIDELFLNQIIDRDCFSRVAPYLSVH